jgi:proteasome lid subunit RPN8/RPN11
VVNERLPGPEDWSAAAESGRAASEGSPAAVAAPPATPATLSAELLQAVIDAARQDLPNETVGLLIGGVPASLGGRPERYLRMTNAAASPHRYVIDPAEQLQVMLGLEEADELIWAIVHSHVASAPVPSATDIGLAFYPDSLYLICSLADDVPEVRAWTIRDGQPESVPLAVV